ncbi:hypothetical protein [Phosphitispora sp. TUW77]|uniref:hypothetical protein n=1 Tax=Phosphitispora sp. TUW77 TaxID=3152361 RepID=UPI003AB323E1
MSNDAMDKLMGFVMQQLGISQDNSGGGQDGSGNNSGFSLNLNPQKVAVIAGILANVLEVQSILIDRTQLVQIILQGSLKRKTPLDDAMNVVGCCSFDQVMQAMLERLS